MARLFISYKREERDYAFALRQWLIDERSWLPRDIFVDVDHIHSGEKWERKILGEAEAAEVMIFLASPRSTAETSFCRREVSHAGGTILVATIDGLSPNDPELLKMLPPRALDHQIASLDQAPVEAVHFISPQDESEGSRGLNRKQIDSLGETLRTLGVAPDSFQWRYDPAGPYPGLRALREGEEAVFFGRQLEIRDAIRAHERLAESVSRKALMIQAPSGAGKSSFLRAGLWRRLRGHQAFTPLCVTRARSGAITNAEWGLASGLAREEANLLGLPRGALQERALDNLPALFAEIAERGAPTGGRPRMLLLGLDQAEEIAALNKAEEAELATLLQAVAAPEGYDIRLVLTVRDDSIDATLKRLAEAGVAQEMVANFRLHRMPPLRFEEVIQGPAEAADREGYALKIPPQLSQALAGAAAGEAMGAFGDALPILALSLQRLTRDYRAADGAVILEPEKATEFLRKSVAEIAAKAIEAARSDETDLRRLVIPQLATWDPRAGQGGAAKRQVAAEADLFAGNRAGLKPLADELVDQHLLTRSLGKNGPALEVAHEALLRVEPLGSMIGEMRGKFVRADALKHEAEAWIDSGRSAEHLARRGERLREAQALFEDEDFGPELKRGELEIGPYLAACAEQAAREEAREEELRRKELAAAQAQAAAAQERQAAAQRVVRRTVAGLAAAVVLALVASWFGWRAMVESERAETALVEAQEQRVLAEAESERAEQNAEEARMQAALAETTAEEARRERDATLLTQSRYLAGFSDENRQKGDVGNAIALAWRALPRDLANPDRPYAIEAMGALYSAYADSDRRELIGMRGHEGWVLGALALEDGRLLSWSIRQHAAAVGRRRRPRPGARRP